jgi:hypothetical protein
VSAVGTCCDGDGCGADFVSCGFSHLLRSRRWSWSYAHFVRELDSTGDSRISELCERSQRTIASTPPSQIVWLPAGGAARSSFDRSFVRRSSVCPCRPTRNPEISTVW